MGVLTNQSNGRKVIFYTFAYNAGKTLPRTINSVLAQTCLDWVWYLVDNGSTDDSGRIIQSYAECDSRIISLVNKQNHVWEPGNGWWDIIWRHTDNDFICFLDADDEYKSDFLEELLAFMKTNNLEIVACGNDFIDVKTGEITGKRVLSSNLLLEGPQFAEYFPLYHQFMRTMWGKLYSIPIIKKFNPQNAPALTYGWDTLFALENFRNASRVGILARSLHKYYVSSQSMSYQFEAKRISSDRILYDATRNFLNDKCGRITSLNEDCLLFIYMSAIKDTLHVLLNAKISDAEKVSGVIDIFTSQQTKQLVARENFGAAAGAVSAMSGPRRELLFSVSNWLLVLQEVPDEFIEGYCDAGELLCAAVENASGWLCFKKLRVQFLIEKDRSDEAKDKLVELLELIPNDPEIVGFQNSLYQTS